MPEKDVIERAQQDAREGKSPSTQAGEFVHEEIEHIRQGKHGATSAKQAIAIGLSKARRAGVKLPPPGAGTSRRTRRKEQGRSAASKASLSKQASGAARKRSAAARSAAARRAVRTKGPRKRSRAAKKAARTRASRSR